jgi:PAS domain S-box-containing protein
LDQFTNEGVVNDTEVAYRTKGGRIMPMSFSASLLHDGNGVADIACIAQDISARKETEHELRRKTAFLEAQVHSSPDGILVVDDTGRRILQNQRAVFLWKIPPEIADDPDDGKHLQFVANQTIHPQQFAERVKYLYAHPDEVGHDEIELKDGTILDRYTAPAKGPDGAYFGRIWEFRDITQRKQTEMALLESELRFRRFAEHIDDVFWSTSPDGSKINYVSPAYEKIWGRSVQALHANPKQWLEAIVLEDRAKVCAVLDKLAVGQAYGIEYRITRPDGGMRWVYDRGFPLRDPSGKVYLTLGVCSDITERKKLEVEVRRHEQRLESFFSGATTGMAIINQEMRYVQINETLAQMNGLPVAAHLGQTIGQVLPKLESILTPLLQQVLATGQPILNMEICGETARQPGVIGHWVASYFPVQGSAGQIEGVGVIVVETTERKLAEEQLRASEERFRQLAENIHEVFWITEVNSGKINYLSPSYEKIWGRSCASLYAEPRTWNDATHPEDQQRVKEGFDQAATRGIFDETYRIIRPDKTVRWIRDRGFPVYNAQGEVYRLVGIAEDITDHRRLEEQLRQSQKMEAIGTLAGGIAHDFNNILAAIGGYTELAKLAAGDNAEVTAHLETVLKASSRAVDLVSQILTFSRQQEQPLKPLQLRPIVEESLKLLRATIPSTVEFSASFAPDTPMVKAVASQVQQVIMNLGTNAWHAMKGRAGRLEIKLRGVDVTAHLATMQSTLQPGRYVQLSISDSGHGMDRKTVERIFEPFFTTKEPGQGTGLGLSVVHGIMQSHGGAVTVDSEKGRGTTFHLYFPACTSGEEKAGISAATIPRGHGEHILYVDDEELLTRLGRENLTSLGYEVTVETNVLEALKRVRLDPDYFDLVITDQTMPVMVGTDFARELQLLRPDLPIIITTGYTTNLTPEQLRAIGIQELLPKPHSSQLLAAAVNRVFSARKA